MRWLQAAAGRFIVTADGVAASPFISHEVASFYRTSSMNLRNYTIEPVINKIGKRKYYRPSLPGYHLHSSFTAYNWKLALWNHFRPSRQLTPPSLGRRSSFTFYRYSSTTAVESANNVIDFGNSIESSASIETSSEEDEDEPEESRLWFQPEGHETGIVVRNGLTRSKVPLIAKENTLTWYMCGPTVYDDAHIGHASCYVRFDVIRRILTDFYGMDVVLVMGITDIDDKIIARSKILGQTPTQIAKHYESRFLSDMRSLGVSPPTFLSRVSDFIPAILDFVGQIESKGHAYHSNGSVYFDVASFDGKDYPRLMKPVPTAGPAESSSSSSWQSAKNVRSSEKRDARDFALWKGAKEGEPGWQSPWGFGRPGWHIECSAMGSRIFGSKVDIHSGGIDLIFPHHENEITQCHAYHSDCDQWVNYWLHAGHLALEDEDEKMSKSLNNTISIAALLENYSADQFRMFCLMSRYRSTMRFSMARMDKAVELCHSISSFLHLARTFIHGKHDCGKIEVSRLTDVLKETKREVGVALADDFDTPTAMRHLANLVHEGYIQLSRKATPDAICLDNSDATKIFIACVSYITRIFHILGLTEGVSSSSSSSSDAQFGAVMDSLVEFRSAVRQFALASVEVPSLIDEEIDAKAKRKKRDKELRKERQPLLSACDALRESLAAQGLQIVDQTKNRPDLRSSWKWTETKGKRES